MRSWADELEKMLSTRSKFVFANPVGHPALPRRVLQPRPVDEEGAGDLARDRFRSRAASSSWSSSAARQLDANDSHVIHIVDWLWQYAFEQRASDIHVEPRRDVGIVRFRIDGVLHQVYAIPTPVLIAMTSRIKLLARMEIVEKRRPQDGRIKTVTPDGDEVELRISTMPTAFGEKLVMRIFTPRSARPRFHRARLHGGRRRRAGSR